ncbi:MAG: hypothetical protein M0T77_11575 [Actinomycetota bacterium]|nr:hypothetical protein [Actinomycetota bacterium]
MAFCFLPFARSFAIGTELAWSIFAVVNLLTLDGVGERTVFTIMVTSCVPVAILATSLGRARARRQ